MAQFKFNGVKKPVGKHLEIMREALKASIHLKQIDLCCGLGFGKTFLLIQIAVLLMQSDSRHRILFLEPDWDRVNDVFVPLWLKLVPDSLYTHVKGKGRIDWWNGAVLHYRPRVITGSREKRRDKYRAWEFSVVLDDETAIEFDEIQHQNTFNRIRLDANVRMYMTATTPKVGPYGRFLKRGGNILFTGSTYDNAYLMKRDPGYVDRMKSLMSHEQVRREIYGELIALEGRIWREAKYDGDPDNKEFAWPAGNRHDQFTEFRKNEPFWLFCDIGSATGAFTVVQRTDAHYRGRMLFDDPVWVAVADLCPYQDASASRAFQRIKQEFGTPVAITGGADMYKTMDTDARTVAYFAEQTFGNRAHILPCSERLYDKQIQYDRLNYLFCSAAKERRFTVARDFVSLDTRSKRGVREMILEDAWPTEDKRRLTDFLPKGKDNTVQHTRDALLMGAAMVMSPPEWLHTEQLTA